MNADERRWFRCRSRFFWFLRGGFRSSTKGIAVACLLSGYSCIALHGPGQTYLRLSVRRERIPLQKDRRYRCRWRRPYSIRLYHAVDEPIVRLPEFRTPAPFHKFSPKINMKQIQIRRLFKKLNHQLLVEYDREVLQIITINI